MTFEWVTLYDRMGECYSQPTPEHLAAALSDLFAHPDDSEHFESWLECGSNDGPLVCHTVTSKGMGRITTYSDADMSDVLSEEEVPGLKQQSTLEAWRAMLAKCSG